MNFFNKLALFAVLAALALGSCDTGLSPAKPDFTEYNKAYDSVDGRTGVSGNPFPTISGNVVVDGPGANTIITAEFRGDLYLDAFEGDPDNDTLTTRLRSFLSFYNVAKATADRNIPNTPVEPGITYTVVRRDAYKVYLQLSVTAANRGYVAY
jgi:hypothetical protein